MNQPERDKAPGAAWSWVGNPALSQTTVWVVTLSQLEAFDHPGVAPGLDLIGYLESHQDVPCR